IIKKWRKESVQEFNNADNADSADIKTTLHPLASCTFGVSRQRRNITNFTGLQVEDLTDSKLINISILSLSFDNK
ncbi:8106_t:CDS:2, partial [Funneliformis caledonium]